MFIKRKTLKIKDKIKILEELKTGMKNKEIALKYGISPSTVTTISHSKNAIMAHANSVKDLKLKKIKSCKFDELNQAISMFIDQAISVKIPLSGIIIKEKAIQFAGKLGITNFSASDGWLRRLKERHALSFKSICGERASVNKQHVDDWVNELKKLLIEFPPHDIFNVDETGLFFRCLPNKTVYYKKEKCFGGKLSKERITILFGANMNGSEKLPPLVIGKSKNPRCFRGIKSLPVVYRHNKKAWMTSELFVEWILELDRKFTRESRKILLFVDNCPAHPKSVIDELISIKLLFFPPNMTSVVQPMDQGVIRSFKHYYREGLARWRIDELENKKKETPITLLDAIYYTAEIWFEKISSNVIINAFKKAYFTEQVILPLNNKDGEIVINDNELILLNPPEYWNEICEKDDCIYEFSSFVDIDKDLSVTGILTDEDIISYVNTKNDSSLSEPTVVNVETPILFNDDDPNGEETDILLKKLYKKLSSKESVPQSIFTSFFNISNFLNE